MVIFLGYNVLDWSCVMSVVYAFLPSKCLPFLQIGNFNVEEFIKFISAIIFVVMFHLDSVFTVFLAIR